MNNNRMFSRNFESSSTRFQNGDVVDLASLQAAGLVKRPGVGGVKLLASGDLKKKLTIKVNKASTSAKAKVEEAGGTLELLTPAPKSQAKA